MADKNGVVGKKQSAKKKKRKKAAMLWEFLVRQMTLQTGRLEREGLKDREDGRRAKEREWGKKMEQVA